MGAQSDKWCKGFRKLAINYSPSLSAIQFVASEFSKEVEHSLRVDLQSNQNITCQ